MFLAAVTTKRQIPLQLLLLGLLWGCFFGWSFVPIVDMKRKWSLVSVETPMRGRLELFPSPRRFRTILYLSNPTGTDEYEGDDGEWADKERNIIRNDVVPVSDELERDLFIPIFSMVAIGGFVGLYGYEMIRLYLRGELYLPFLN